MYILPEQPVRTRNDTCMPGSTCGGTLQCVLTAYYQATASYKSKHSVPMKHMVVQACLHFLTLEVPVMLALLA